MSESLSSYRRVVVLRRAESRKLREVLHGESRAKLSEKLYFHRLYFVVVVAEYDILLFHLEHPHKDKGLWMKTKTGEKCLSVFDFKGFSGHLILRSVTAAESLADSASYRE